MTQQFKIDDIARVIRVGSAGPHMQGAEGRVVKVTDGWVYVEDRTGQGLFNYGDVKSYMFQPHDLEMVSERLADWEKELLGIKTKQELKVGDKVRLLTDGGYKHENALKAGAVSTVQRVNGGIVTVDGWSYYYNSGAAADEVELVVAEKPKARSQEIEKHEIQKGDLIVAFWDNGGVETRKKGIAHEKDFDGDWTTSEGEYLTYSDEAGGSRVSIYLLERPEVKEPELADGTYWVTEKDVNDSFWWKVVVKDSKATWGIRGDMSDKAYADYEYLVKASKGNVHVVHTTNPFPEPMIQEQLDDLGVKTGDMFTHKDNAGYIYQFLSGTGLRFASTRNPSPFWCPRSVVLEDVEDIVAGAFTKIS